MKLCVERYIVSGRIKRQNRLEHRCRLMNLSIISNIHKETILNKQKRTNKQHLIYIPVKNNQQSNVNRSMPMRGIISAVQRVSMAFSTNGFSQISPNFSFSNTMMRIPVMQKPGSYHGQSGSRRRTRRRWVRRRQRRRGGRWRRRGAGRQRTRGISARSKDDNAAILDISI